MIPRRLATLEAVNLRIRYDPINFTAIRDLVNTPQHITIDYFESSFLFPLGVTGYMMSSVPPIKFEGYLNKFTPEGEEEGEPVATLEIREL